MGSNLAEFCLQLLKSKDQNEARLSSIIQTRKEARTYFHEVSTAHKLVGEGIRRLEDENNAHFVQMNSFLESSFTIDAGETAESLSRKIEEASVTLEEDLKKLELDLNEKYLQHVNGRTKINFSFYRDKKKLCCTLPAVEQHGEKLGMLKAATHSLLSLYEINSNKTPAAPPARKPVPLPRAPPVRPGKKPKAPRLTTPSAAQPGTSINPMHFRLLIFKIIILLFFI